MIVFWQLIRPGLLATVLFSTAVAALTTAAPPTYGRLAHALLGTALLIAGATVMNQLMERRQDALMPRTASRPLPSSRLSARSAVVFAFAASLAGVGWLLVTQPPTVPLLAVLSWCLYVLIYTPLKRISIWHTPVGALAGAMPILLGSATANAVCSPFSLILFGAVFFWQFPHTAAIGWIYREQYSHGQMKVAAIVDPSGRLAGWLAVIGALGAFLTSLFPITSPTAGWFYGSIAVMLGLGQVIYSVKFLARPTDDHARRLWWMSLIYLPALLASLLTVR